MPESIRNNVIRKDIKLKIIAGIILGFALSETWIYFTSIKSNVNPATWDPINFWIEIGIILLLFIFGMFSSCFLFFRNSPDKLEIKQYNLAIKAFVGTLAGFFIWLMIVVITHILRIKMDNLITGVGGCFTILLMIIILWLYPKNNFNS
jgi:Kef-type K+ transport system membrane component KefB